MPFDSPISITPTAARTDHVGESSESILLRQMMEIQRNVLLCQFIRCEIGTTSLPLLSVDLWLKM